MAEARRVGIDLTALLPESTGVENYMLKLVGQLARQGRDREFTLFLNREDRWRFDGMLPGNFRPIACATRSRLTRLAAQQAVLPAATRALGLEILHSPAFIMPLDRASARHVVTIHDMTFFTMPDVHPALRRSAAFRTAVKTSIRRADRICVPSRHTRSAVLEVLGDVDPDRLRVIPLGVDDAFEPLPEEAVAPVRRRLDLPKDYLLHVSTMEPRKNLLGLLAGYRQLIGGNGSVPPLVLAGRPGWDLEPLRRELASPDLRERVRVLGYVSQGDLPALYSGASAFAFPSLAEGFGLPPLEAMACGVPTVAADNSAMAELLDGAAELVPARDPEALASALRRVLTDEALRSRLRERGRERAQCFSWAETARRTLEVYDELGQS